MESIEMELKFQLLSCFEVCMLRTSLFAGLALYHELRGCT